MRVLINLNKEDKYSTYVDGALAGWENKEERTTFLTLYGEFPVGDEMASRYTIHFKTDVGLSLVKKLEKEGTADLTTDYVRGLIVSEKYE
jgi:hypothetical protein